MRNTGKYSILFKQECNEGKVLFAKKLEFVKLQDHTAQLIVREPRTSEQTNNCSSRQINTVRNFLTHANWKTDMVADQCTTWIEL